MSARRRRGEDEFADERPWPPEDDNADGWLPGADDDWADDQDQASGGGRRGRHSGAPGEPGGTWDPTASLPRQAGPRARPAPGRSPGWEDDYPPRREPEPPSRRAAPWDDDPRSDDRYPGRSAPPGERYAGPAGRGPAGQGADPGVGPRSRRGGAHGAPPASYQDTGNSSAGYSDTGDRYPGPAGAGADPLRRPSSGDPAGQYGGRPGTVGPARYRDSGGHDDGDGDAGGQYRDQGGWDREATAQRDVPGDRRADPGGRYRDPAGSYGDPGGRADGRDAPYGDPAGRPGDRGRGYGGPPGRPDVPSGRRSDASGRYSGAGDGYPPPGRGGPGDYPEPGARRGGDGYRDEYRDWPDDDRAAGGRRAPRDQAGRSGGAGAGYGNRRGYADEDHGPERDDPGWDGEDDYQQDEGWPFGGGAGDGDSGDRKRRKRRGRWAGPSSLLIVAAIILIPLIVGGIYAYRVISAHYNPPNYSGSGTGTVIFEVKTGDTATTVGNRLVTDGVVASARALELAAEHSSNTNLLQPGYYRLHKHMNAQLAWNLLVSPAARVQLKVTIPEGWRVSQTLAVLSKQSGIPVSDFTKAIKDTSALGLPSYAKGNPEGYLYPATYEIPPHSTATSVLKQMVTAFNQEAASVNLPKAAAHDNLTPAEAIVVASLAQAEGGKLSDFPKITRVIYNRLQQHMPLGLDSTVLFALNTYGIAASDQQLKVKSPYNTYTHTGLPPGPIDSPGNAAIQAALHPAKGNWLYFVTVNPKTKQTDFTSSPAVFQQLKNQLQQYLSSHGG